MQSIELSDVEQIVRLVADAGDPTVEIPLPERKRILLEGLARLIDANVWIWSTSVPNPDVLGDVVTTCLIDGGWKNDQEQVAVYELLSGSEFGRRVQTPIVEAVRNGKYITLLRNEIIPDDEWKNIGKIWHRTGLDNLLLTLYPLTHDSYSAIGFHRRLGRPNFTERDRAIVHVVFQQVEWLHWHGTNTPAKRKVVQLSARERQVLVFLLSGNSRKEIAQKLAISEHTVGDYMKQLHKHFSVNSRAELQAYFLSGGQPST